LCFFYYVTKKSLKYKGHWGIEWGEESLLSLAQKKDRDFLDFYLIVWYKIA
jgi:hypothetical protein